MEQTRKKNEDLTSGLQDTEKFVTSTGSAVVGLGVGLASIGLVRGLL